jgi:uncharacterized protein (DUF983 family)
MSTGSRIVTALRRGWHKRCPHCGIGAQFRGWADPIERCSNCGLVFEPNQGDTWFFVIVGDRLPVALTLVVVYFNLGALSRTLGIISFVFVLAVLIWTTPGRWGVANALHYLSRVFWPDASDPIPK